VTHIGQTVKIDVLAFQEEVGASAHIHDGLDEIGSLLFADRSLVANVAGAGAGAGGEERNDPSMGEHHSLIEKFLPIEELGVWPNTSVPTGPQRNGPCHPEPQGRRERGRPWGWHR
jgi:hypothetical protein